MKIRELSGENGLILMIQKEKVNYDSTSILIVNNILGDLELKSAFSEYEVCDQPEGIRAQVISGAEPSDAFTRISTDEGFYCSNDEINQCDDWSVSWCCDKWATGDRHCMTKGELIQNFDMGSVKSEVAFPREIPSHERKTQSREF